MVRMEPQEGNGRTGLKRLLKGIRIAFAIVVALPFIVVLFPFWHLYCWSEQRAGRPAPYAPWTVLRHALSQRGESGDVWIPLETTATQEEELAVGGGAASLVAVFDDPGRSCELLKEGLSSGGVALVTGGGRRLGRQISLALAGLGFRVGVIYHRDGASADQTVAMIRQAGGQAESLALDLSNPDSMVSLLRDAERLLGGVPDVLVNNAALFQPTPLVNGSWEAMTAVLQVNLQGPLWLSLQVGERMLRHQGGQIIHVCDIWGERPLSGYAAYSAAKAGLIMATLALSKELGPNVRVNAIAPGAILPPDGTTQEEADGFLKLLARTPLAQHADPVAVVRAVHYLLGARFVTGEVLHVDGGRRLV